MSKLDFVLGEFKKKRGKSKKKGNVIFPISKCAGCPFSMIVHEKRYCQIIEALEDVDSGPEHDPIEMPDKGIHKWCVLQGFNMTLELKKDK
jgi:hypothetical protein